MSASHSEASTGRVEMLPGVRHYQESGFANTWEAYDALTEADGWRERFAEDARWKDIHRDGRWLLVHAPTHERAADSLDAATGEGRR